MIGVLNKLKRFLPVNIKVALYNSLILPHISYGLTVTELSSYRKMQLE